MIQIDADGNGIADSMELTPNQLVVRKTALFFKTVNPNKITDAVAGTIHSPPVSMVSLGYAMSSGRHNISQWVKTTDLRFKTDSKSVIFSDGSYHVYHWILLFYHVENI